MVSNDTIVFAACLIGALVTAAYTIYALVAVWRSAQPLTLAAEYKEMVDKWFILPLFGLTLVGITGVVMSARSLSAGAYSAGSFLVSAAAFLGVCFIVSQFVVLLYARRRQKLCRPNRS
jgi:hypothetical protein